MVMTNLRCIIITTLTLTVRIAAKKSTTMFFLRYVKYLAFKALAKIFSFILSALNNAASPQASIVLALIVCIHNCWISRSSFRHTKTYLAIDMAQYLANRSPLISRLLINFERLQKTGELGEFGELSQEYDPRLLPALWVNYILASLESSYNVEDLELPFLWSSALNLELHLDSKSYDSATECAEFLELLGIKKANSMCQEESESISKYSITGPTDEPLSETTRAYLAANYLLHTQNYPHRAVFLGAGPADGSERLPIVVPIFGKSGSLYSEGERSNFLLNSRLALGPWISLEEEINRLRSLRKGPESLPNLVGVSKDEFGVYRVNRTVGEILEPEDFQVPPLAQLSETDFTSSVDPPPHKAPDSKHALVDSRNELDSRLDHHEQETNGYQRPQYELNLNAPKASKQNSKPRRRLTDLDVQLAANVRAAPSHKYFHEANLKGSHKGCHYDWRFFRKSNYSPYERTEILQRLTRAWLRFTNGVGVQLWLAHGSLLGWHWNGLNMPWDDDLDVQVTMKSLYYLARNFNQSVVLDLTDPEQTGRMYFIDVNPLCFQREKGNGANVIDARFIDALSGLYVDITGLAVSGDLENVQNNPGSRQNTRLHQVFDPDFAETAKLFDQAPELRESTEKQLHKLEMALWSAGRLYNCKDNHFFLHSDISPLESTFFEGVPAFVPKKHHQILQREYSRGTSARRFRGWRFSAKLGIWVPEAECGKAQLGCDKPEWHFESFFSRNSRHYPHNRTFAAISTTNAKIDPWLLKRNKRLLRLFH